MGGQAIWKQGPENQKIPTCKGRQRVKGQKGGESPPCGRGAAAKWTWRPSQKKRQEVRGSQRRPVLPKGHLPPRRHKKGGEPPKGARLPAAGKRPSNSRPLQTSAAKPQKGRAQTASPTAGAGLHHKKVPNKDIGAKNRAHPPSEARNWGAGSARPGGAGEQDSRRLPQR